MLTPAEQAPLERQLAEMYHPISADLARTEEIIRQELKSEVGFVAELTARARLYRGKRLRPALLLLAARACGGVRPEHHTLAAVVEMIHTATLVHDDVLDEAECRRHASTVNAEWGNEASVLLGDFLFTHAFVLAGSLGSTHACRLIGQATNRVCEGELHQISRRGIFELCEDEYLCIIMAKTAALVACCCQLGAHFAGAAAATESVLYTFGRQLGIAFQITDDLLDLLGDETSAGKSLGSDLEKQKVTLPLIRFRQTAGPAALDRCRRIFEQPGPGAREAIVAHLQQSDAIAYSRARARQYAAAAASQLDLLADSPARQALAVITRFVLDRNG